MMLQVQFMICLFFVHTFRFLLTRKRVKTFSNRQCFSGFSLNDGDLKSKADLVLNKCFVIVCSARLEFDFDFDLKNYYSLTLQS